MDSGKTKKTKKLTQIGQTSHLGQKKQSQALLSLSKSQKTFLKDNFVSKVPTNEQE